MSKLVKMTLGALALAGALGLGSVPASAEEISLETQSRHWASSVEC